MYTPCIHGRIPREAILASEEKRKMDLDTCKGVLRYAQSCIHIQVIGGRRMIYVVCRYCGKYDLVPKCVNELELCFSCIMDVVPYD